jgi:L-fucose mutarotase/ribose pyranase (RbsD/FucU family)
MNEDRARPAWLEKLETALPVFGHRNWIVVADSAYPAHSSTAIETVLATGNHTEVLRAVLKRIDAAAHLSGTVYVDAELAAVAEEDAPGVSAYRQELDRMLSGRVRAAAHDEIIAKLDAARRFRVLIIKTPMRIPYTSVFIELGCGYWTPEAEAKLRTALNPRRERTNE